MTAKQKARREKYAHFLNVTVSQNFLTSRRLLERIVRKSTITKADVVVEIGTGKGHLTKVLCERCRYLYSVEIDRKLYEYSKQKLAATENLKLICGDFLKYQLPRKGEYKVFANIPYNITTEIVMKCVNASNPPTEMWLVMEKGVAKRFMGIPDHNKKSADLKMRWALEIVYFFEREDFHPKPSVDSVLVHFRHK